MLSNVPPLQAEVDARIAEYRRLGWQRRAPAQVVYQEPSVLCPWLGCGYRIDGIHFCLEKWANPALLEQYLFQWWNGPGLIGKCPGCHNLVLFDLTEKQRVEKSVQVPTELLPDDWVAKASVVTRSLGYSNADLKKL